VENLVEEFAELYEVATSYVRLIEAVEPERLLEMSKLTARETGLPVDVWIDEGRTFTKSGHGRRIKFQGDRGDPNTRNWVPMTIEAEPRIPVENAHYDLSAKELDCVKLFVKINLEALEKLGEPGFGITDFAKEMKRT
jgi:hypothetical protein